jgi:Phage capsid family
MTFQATQANRDRITDVRERLSAARKGRADARYLIETGQKHDDAVMVQTGAAQLAQTEIDIEIASELQAQLLRQMSGVSVSVFRDSFLDDPQMVETLEQVGNSSAPVGSMMLGPAVSRDELISQIQSTQTFAAAGDVEIADTARVGPYKGVVPQLRRPLRLLDLIPTSAMDGKSFDYTQEGGTFDTALETPEAATKPMMDLELADAQVIAKTVAHWTKLKRQQLADVPSLQTTVQTRLSYGVMRRVENQIVGGDGTGENLLGILNTAGVATVAFGTGPLSDLTLDGIVGVLLADAQPNAVVINPASWAQMLKATASGSGERLDSNGAFSTPATSLWGLPLIASSVIAPGKALVGDFSHGCQLYVREGVNVRISDADQDDFIRNRITMLGEGRFGLAIWQPTAFAIVDLA